LHQGASNGDWAIDKNPDPDTWVSRQTYQLRERRQEDPVERVRDHNDVCAVVVQSTRQFFLGVCKYSH
jgi:hypothetical protein